MADPFIGEIRIFAGSYEPYGWAFCNGQMLTISENPALYAVIGITYGGNGKTTFALPNLQGRAPIHCGQGEGLSGNYVLGKTGGNSTVTLTSDQMPSHTHRAQATTTIGTSSNPENAIWAKSKNVNLYGGDTPDTLLSNLALQVVGKQEAHDNQQPYLGINFIMATDGEFPVKP